MKLKNTLLLLVTIIGLNNCGGGAGGEHIESGETNTLNQTTSPLATQEVETKTIVNNEAVSFPQGTNGSAPTEEIATN